jgi:hypothetical protein
MQSCEQTTGQSILDHGLSVWEQLQAIIKGDSPDTAQPQWLTTYKDQILSSLHPSHILEQYTIFHDCGKPACLTFGEDGKRHFPDHARVSAETYAATFGKEGDHGIIGELISRDMLFHTGTFEEIIGLNLSKSTLCTLMLTALAEIHSNAKTFYPDEGIRSTWFKIKFKRLEKLGNRICKRLFDHSYMYAITRKDLSTPQQAVQAGHAAIEAARSYLTKDDEHPSLILCTVKNEAQLNRAADELEGRGIKLRRFYEPDRGNEFTAFATEPLKGDRRECMRKFQLMK